MVEKLNSKECKIQQIDKLIICNTDILLCSKRFNKKSFSKECFGYEE
jgi:hypothetical protein